MSILPSALRNHLHFIVVVGFLLIVMTWPTIVYVFDTETFWLPTDNRDAWINIWDAWHGQSVLNGEASFDFTNVLFYPVGMSLDYNPNNVFHAALQAMLQPHMGTSNAFNLIYLLFILLTALSAYGYLNYLFRDRWLALFGALVFGLSPHVISHSQHPTLNLLATIPLALYALQRGIEEQKWKWLILCGVLAGITAFIGMYLFVCLLLTMALFIGCFTRPVWRQARFWIGLLLSISIVASIGMVRVYPMIRNASRLEVALQKNAGQERNNDLLSFFINGGHPWLTPVFVEVFDMDGDKWNLRNQHRSSYLGYLPILLIALAFRFTEYRQKMIPWLLLILPFLILRLGSTLRINGELFPDVLLPKHFLNNVFPWIFQAINVTDHFQIGALLPLAVLSCFGLHRLLKSAGAKRRHLIVLVAIAALAVEYYQSPLSRIVSKEEIAFNYWLKGEPNQDDIRLINLPMGRPNSKLYGFYQTINSYPHAEGLARRTPAGSYEYINQNVLLALWRQYIGVACRLDSFDSYLAAIEQLLGDGFSHVIHHHRETKASSVADSFKGIAPAYQDKYVSIYRLSDLRDLCLDRVATYQDQLPGFKEFLHSPTNQPRTDVSLIYIYPADYYSNEAMRYYDDELSQWRDLIHVVYDTQDSAAVVNSDGENIDLDSIATKNNMFWLIYDPGESDPRNQSHYATWMLQNLRFCQQIFRGEVLVVEFYIDRAYPCELVVTEDPLELRYDNGITLANLLTDFNDDQLSVDSWWQRGDIRGHAYTIQVFDEGGIKQLQIDQVIDSRPLSRRQIDTSSLEPGDYVAKLIVYETESGRSQSGTIPSAQLTVERELEIARFSVQS